MLVPALATQRALLDIPKGPARFEAYLGAMGRDADLKLPLPAFNPMAGPPVADALDAWLALDIEAAAAPHVEGPERVCFVIADADGGWTDRARLDHDTRFTGKHALHHGWAVALLWADEAADSETGVARATQALARLRWQQQHGLPTTLWEHLSQEVAAGTCPDPGEIADTEDFGATFATLWGDDAAARMGHQPLGGAGLLA